MEALLALLQCHVRHRTGGHRLLRAAVPGEGGARQRPTAKRMPAYYNCIPVSTNRQLGPDGGLTVKRQLEMDIDDN